MYKLILSLFIVHCSLFTALGQGIGIGQWRDHLPYNNCVAVAEANDNIYCATEYCLFVYNLKDNSLTRLNKINGLSDFGISTIKYNSKYKCLLVAYSNANLDIIDENGSISNYSDIKNKQSIEGKNINRITFIGDYAYLSCTFGIVVFSLINKEFSDTYYIGPGGSSINVNDFTSDGKMFYAAADDGIYTASTSPNVNLADYNSWSKIQSLSLKNKKINLLAYFNNKLYANQTIDKRISDTLFVFDGLTWAPYKNIKKVLLHSIQVTYNKLIISGHGFVDIFDNNDNETDFIGNYNDVKGMPIAMDAVYDKNNNLWIADSSLGMINKSKDGNIESLYPQGPATNKVLSLRLANNNLWVVTGGLKPNYDNDWGSNSGRLGTYVYNTISNVWTSLTPENTPALSEVNGYISIGIDPFNPDNTYIGTWSLGMIRFINNQFNMFYDKSNSTISSLPPQYNYGPVRVGGICFDSEDNMWVANPGPDNPISVKMAGDNGSWYSFNIPHFNENFLTDIIVDDNNQKWIIVARGAGLLVYNDNNTISNPYDDQYKRLTSSLPSSNVLSIAKDLDGSIWVGTDRGIGVIYSPGNVMTGSDTAQQILVLQNGHWQHLLETETVKAIAIDGANRKWFGTQNSGVFLMSADGTTQIQHFTEDNSPLLSNTITSIAIDQLTGEVFFGTINGIISYKSDATEGKETFSDKSSAFAYPNPVKKGYEGPIAIKGLVTNAHVKITSISGNLVYTTTALGGQAIWNGKNLSGDKVSTGVYLVFCSNDDGTQTLVTKIMYIK